MVLCQICGNEIDQGQLLCPFCRGKQELRSGVGQGAGLLHKVVNLEIGKPTVETALRKLQGEIASARRHHLHVLTVIHGYGSSGKGGAIGVECRKMLDYLKGNGEINTFIYGEDFRQKSGPTRDLLRRFPQLANNVNLNQGNRGITLVVL